jgi:hypothetical protein
MSDTGKGAILRRPPDGWWYHSCRNYGEDTEGSWIGPFDSWKEAHEMAKALEPDRQKEVTIVKLARWETKVVSIK